MALIPVVLEFSGVAKDASLNLTLTSDGAVWSIGGDDALESEGFSYNGLGLGEPRPGCLTSIELTESVLAIRTSPHAAAAAFSLTLFVEVQPEVESIEGHCTLNAGATVACHLGYDVGAKLGSGPFSAIVRAIPEDVRRLRLNVQRAPVGVPISIDLLTEHSQGEAYWCFDSGAASGPGLSLRGAAASPLPVKSFTITDRQIVLIPSGSQKVAGDIFVEVFLRRVVADATTDSPSKRLKRFHLRAVCDPNAAVVAQFGVQQPRYLAASYSRFHF